jgi:hypothetical protein
MNHLTMLPLSLRKSEILAMLSSSTKELSLRDQ